MLPRKNRLLSYLIPEILKKGKRFYFSFFTLIIVDQDKKNHSSRFGVIVPIKVDKRSSQRHKIKRQLNNIIQANLDKIRPGYNVIFLVNKKVMAEKFASMKSELARALKKSKLVLANEKIHH